MKTPPYLRAAALALSLSASVASADTFTWDSGGASPAAPNAAAGIWNTTNAYWSDGTTDFAWNNADKDTARFIGGASYSVTVADGVSVGGMIFDHTAGTVTVQSSTITLTPSASSVTINHSGGGSGGVTISSVLTGSSNLIKSGGNVTLSGLNTYTGSTTISSGNLFIGVSNTLPSGTDLIFTSNNTLWMSGKDLTVASLAGTNANAVIRNHNSPATNSTLTLGGSDNTSFAGGIGVTADTTRTLSLIKSGTGTQTLTKTTLEYTGSTLVSGGTLKLGGATAGNLTRTSSVTISGGTLTNAAGDTDLGLGAVSMDSGAMTPGGVGTIGSFTVALDQNFTATGGTLNFDIGTGFDQIFGSGTGTFSLTDTTLALSGDISVAGTYTLFSGFSSGSVSNLTITGLAGGFTGSLANTGVLTVSAVPEPATYSALAGAAILGFAALRRRRVRA
jgi:autotransporter-associated beta strand protein